jgi:hypothetical protein
MTLRLRIANCVYSLKDVKGPRLFRTATTADIDGHDGNSSQVEAVSGTYRGGKFTPIGETTYVTKGEHLESSRSGTIAVQSGDASSGKSIAARH